MTLDLQAIRAQFPILSQPVAGKPLVYLDNAATTQKPQAVIERLNQYYCAENANIHRGVHHLSMKATGYYEAARESLRAFINAAVTEEIIFVRGTTEAINLVAQSFARPQLKAGDEIVISAMEHHSNIVPWQMVCEQTGAVLKVAPMNASGELILEDYQALLTDKVKLVALVEISNAIGTVNPVKDCIAMAHEKGIPVLIDGAQAVAHAPVDVQDLDADFYAFSGHKMYGPTGIGVLYGKKALLEAMPPYHGGGDMIRTVSFEKSTYADLPAKFEAGTPNIADVIAFAEAVNFINAIGKPAIMAHETALLQHAKAQLQAMGGIQLVGEAKEQAGAISFVMDDAHPHDIGTILDQEGVAVRTGHHCAMPLMDFFQVPATVRLSLAVYNSVDEIDAAIAALNHVKRIFSA